MTETQKREKNPSITIKIVIKSQEKKSKRKEQVTAETARKQLTK